MTSSSEERTGYRSGDPKFRPPPPDRSAGEGRSGKSGAAAGGGGPATCDLCGAPMLDRNCKLVCTGCGYQRDCSDP